MKSFNNWRSYDPIQNLFFLVLNEPDINHRSSKWRLINLSQYSCKMVYLHSGITKPPIQIAHYVLIKETTALWT